MSSRVGGQEALLALGSNLGEPLQALRGAVSGLQESLKGLRVSRVYRSPPEGGAHQPDYLNAVVRGFWSGSAAALLAVVQALEAEAGRARPYPGAPRTLDIDVLFLGTSVVAKDDLRVPHPRWANRPFVVVPLLDVAPDWVDPVSGRTVTDVAEELGWTRNTLEEVASSEELLPAETR